MSFGKKNLGQDVWIQNNITSVTWPKQLNLLNLDVKKTFVIFVVLQIQFSKKKMSLRQNLKNVMYNVLIHSGPLNMKTNKLNLLKKTI